MPSCAGWGEVSCNEGAWSHARFVVRLWNALCTYSDTMDAHTNIHAHTHTHTDTHTHTHTPHIGYKKTDFLKEIDRMKLVAKGNHTHVVSFVGSVTVQESLCLITEFVRHGDLLAYLQNIRRMVR